MSKTAIIFAGFFRTFDHVKESLKGNIIDPLDCDVFFSSPRTVFAPAPHEVTEFHGMHSVNDRLVEPWVCEFFGPRLRAHAVRDYDSQPYKDVISKNGIAEKNFCNQWTWRILSQMHGISLSIRLFGEYVKENQKRYDVVILARGDVKYYSPFDASALAMDKVNYQNRSYCDGKLMTVHPDTRPSPTLHKAFNDQILVGSQENMLAYGDIYDRVLEYVSAGIDFNPETLMGHHLLRNGIDWVGNNFISYELWRHER